MSLTLLAAAREHSPARPRIRWEENPTIRPVSARARRFNPGAWRAGERDHDVVTAVDGEVAPGFERVREAFGRNFEHDDDVGAAVCVYRHGRKVADLWGGVADNGTGREWTRDTLPLADLLAWDPM